MPLHRVLERVREHRQTWLARRRPVAVFDLDSTLFSTQMRNYAILREFAARPHAPDELRRVVDRLTHEHMRWNCMDDLRTHGYVHEGVLRELRGFWFRRFFTSEYLRHDLPLPGASSYVADVHAEGATVVYLTGRPQAEMGPGTRASLVAHGFPLDDQTAHLMLKPTFDEPDHAFKERAVHQIAALGDVVASFENEPKNANIFHDAWPDAEHVLLDTVCSPDPPPLRPRITRIRDFQR